MGDEVCEIEEIEEEATMATVQVRRKGNYYPADSSDGGPHIFPRDISPTLGPIKNMRKAQNGGDKTDEEQRRHRKGKEGSGGLPLYLFLQESVASEGGRKVDQRCPNASNPYHMCTDRCLTKISETKRDDAPKSPFAFLSRHSRSSSGDGSSGEGAKVDPRCPNSSNPYHECTGSCSSKFRQTDREDGTKYPFPITPHGSPTSSEGSSRDGRKVDPRCPNSSNPYHECTDNCHSKFRQTDRKDKAKSPSHLFSRSSRSSSANSSKLGDNRKVDLRCVNASNPYHECGDHCYKKLQEGNHTVPNTPGSSTLRKIKGNVQSVERSEGVHPDCVNASNPYHKCSNNCYEKMQR